MPYEYDFDLTPQERARLDERRDALQSVRHRLREAAEGEEPLSNVMDLEHEP